MELIKHAHACVTLTKDGRTLLIDPGTFTPNSARLMAEADAILVTHEHFDHVDETALRAELARRPGLRVHSTAEVAAKLGQQALAVAAGDRIEVAGFDVSVHGERHALIHADIPQAQNVGFLVDDHLFHPGDSYSVPDGNVETLLVPTSGPWTKLGEAADFVRAVRPGRTIQIHELMLSELGQNSTAGFLGEDGLTDTPLEILPVGRSTAL
ncbi:MULTISPECIES: MBL fold metallo-hydrolase [Streptomyces]|uniref:MBL fold metallo-hydrolase n=1 Tax=Streptomyces xanthochromogenes TaxID=67384 RepID=A0ABQ2ZJI6_9ACTN|nr:MULTISPECIES: MBL fold metallo-hydrolase [Streptomyces]MYV92559.1 MBL fold metallo-hydrolase [Streptomyces sp. SID1034]GGY15254.1 MBL fold metallo-hydrolase [Streptomyces xanthochromogenes]